MNEMPPVLGTRGCPLFCHQAAVLGLGPLFPVSSALPVTSAMEQLHHCHSRAEGDILPAPALTQSLLHGCGLQLL